LQLTAALAAAAILAPAIAPAPALARHIVLSNDDGLTSNVVALYRALKAQGHDVVVSVPCTNQSGMGTASWLGRPLGPLTAPCRSDAAAPGDPGAGPMTRADLPPGDFHYVAGTPVMAMLYGIDVAGRRRWGSDPDLVLSGLNEGQNVGSVILGSGTVSNARVAAMRGVPAIAFSAGFPTFGDDRAQNPQSRLVAERAARLVAALDRAAGNGPVLPRGIALNVNFPDRIEGAPWRITRVGTYDAYRFTFVENMARDATPGARAMAERMGTKLPELPGIVGELARPAPRADQLDDEGFVHQTAIAISPLTTDNPPPASALTRLRRTLAAFVRGQ